MRMRRHSNDRKALNTRIEDACSQRTGECSQDDPRQRPWTYTIAVYSGDWTDEDHPKMGGFECSNNERPYNHGDPVEYPFFTTFPNHYHEYDEYFLIMRGRGIFMDDGVLYNVEPGDLVATRRGVHHQVVACWDDVMICSEFGSRLGGQMRPYFLYEHTHGKPLCED